MKRFLPLMVLVLSAAALAVPSEVQATCMTNCTAVPTLPDCSAPIAGEWPFGTLFHTTIKCETCCSAPGGPSNCSDEPVNLDWIKMKKDGKDMDGVFHLLETQCNKVAMFDFEPMLSAGSYQLLLSSPQSGNLILASFDVATPECTTNADCSDCKSCNNKGVCEDVGLPACTTDADCGKDAQCAVNANNPCNNVCENIVPSCKSDEDCGPCEGCSSNGECHAMPSLPPECGADEDCEDGATCVSDECTAWCVLPDPGCTTDEQCGSCKACSEGKCIDTGSVPCTETEPCADPSMTCVVNPDDPCQNLCEPAQSDDTGGMGQDAGTSTDAGSSGDTGMSTDTASSSDTGTTTETKESDGGGCMHGGAQQRIPVLLIGLALLSLTIRKRWWVAQPR